MVSLFRSAALAAVCLGFAGFSPARADEQEKPKIKFELRRAETKPADGLTPAEVPGGKDKIYLHKASDVTNEDVASASVGVSPQTFKPVIEILFTKDGAKKVEKLSEEHIDKPLAIMVDGKVIGAPVIKAKFTDKAQITGEFTKKEAEKIAKALGGK